MSKKKNFNVLDFGSSKIRFSVFDNELSTLHSDTKSIEFENNFVEYFDEIKLIIKKAEKKISNHIEDLILSLDLKDLLTIDISLKKNLDGKSNIKKIYNFFILELEQIVDTFHDKYQIIHTIFNKCIINNKVYYEIPEDIELIDNIKVDFKLICFPRILLKRIINVFNKNNINVSNVFCTSYIKSKYYLPKLGEKNISFLEIGYKKTIFICYKENKLKFIQIIPIGGFHITSDISKIFNVTFDEAEKIKMSFYETESEFSYKKENNNSLVVQEILSKNISINDLKSVILYRVQEIIDLNFKQKNLNNNEINLNDSELFLIGNGSLLFKNNSFHLSDKFEFKSLNFYDETDSQICKSSLVYYLNNYKILKKNTKKLGLFEKFFNYFSE